MAFFTSERCEKKLNPDKCQEHTGKKLFCCETCDKEIIGNIKLQKNIIIPSPEKEKTFNCDVCDKVFDQKINLMMHMCVHTIKVPFQFQKGNSNELNNDNPLEDILLPANIEVHKCLICEQDFTDKNKFLRHKCSIKEPFQLPNSNAEETNCDDPLETTVMSATIKLHNCLICEQEFTEKDEFLRHKCDLKESFELEDRDVKLADNGDLMRTMLIPANSELHECLICEQEFTDKDKFLRHKCDIKESFQLENSNVNLSNNSNFIGNMMIPIEIELHECLTCEREFTDKDKFLRHKCTVKKPFQYEKCGKKEIKKSDFLGKMSSTTNFELSNCQYCKREFTDKSKFLRHMRTHTGERPFKCTVCQKGFSQSYTLVRHMRTHTGERPFGCYVCGRRFNQSGALRQHVRIHTGEKPYQCSICDKKFTSNGNLVHHVRVHTKD